MHWSVSAGVSKSLSSGKPPRRGWPSLRLPPLFLFCFPLISLLSPHLYSPPRSVFLLSSLLISLWLSPFFLCLSVLFQNHSSYLLHHLHLCFCLSVFTLCPLSLNGPQCCEIWFPCSQNCKASWDQRSKSKECSIEKERERGIESVARQTHETTVASPPKRQAQRLGPEKLAGPLSTSLGAILNTNRRGLAVETKPWCHAAYFPWKAPGVLGPTPGDMRSP